RLPDNLPGGEYTVVASEAASRFAPEKRKILVNRYERPRLNKELTLHRKSYGPGEEVQASLKFTRGEDGAAYQGILSATLRVDNLPVQVKQSIAGPNGKASFNFTLPAAIERGDASLSV